MGLLAFFFLICGLPFAAVAVLLFANGNYILAVATLLIGVGRDYVDTKKIAEKAPERIREKVKYVERKVFVGATLTRNEAFSVLGIPIQEGTLHVTKEAVNAAYKKMMLRVHPDQGGSPYLATKVNEAKQLLLGR